ncbi:cation-binding protein [Candidatus Woesearchaeota archaeon]|nr:cation-binding protein [Candidatus Woesearchaeota archaeon]
MEKPTKILSDEHVHILKVVNALIKECDALEDGKGLDKDFFEKAVDFIQNYADKFHHAKEEDIFFVELNKDDVQMHCNPVEQMLLEHNLGRDFVKGLVEGIEKDDKNKVIENSRGYSQLLQEHIYKEDNILYPMADEALNEDIQKSILDKFKKAEQDKFTEGTKEKYIELANEMEGKVKTD